jgi:hypothetical protein
MARTLARRQTSKAPVEDDEETEVAEEKTTARRRRGSSDAEETTSTRKRGRGGDDEAPAKSSLSSGWAGHKKSKAKSSRFNDEDKFTVDENDEQLIIFLDDEPFATWNEHFLKDVDGKKSFVCAEDSCPICETGDTPGYRAAFNIVVFDGDGNPTVKYWSATPDPLDAIEAQAFHERTGPLTNPTSYFVVLKKKKAKRFHYTMERVQARDISAEFGFEPLSEAEIEELIPGKFEIKDAVKPSTMRELRDAADEVS